MFPRILSWWQPHTWTAVYDGPLHVSARVDLDTIIRWRASHDWAEFDGPRPVDISVSNSGVNVLVRRIESGEAKVFVTIRRIGDDGIANTEGDMICESLTPNHRLRFECRVDLDPGQYVISAALYADPPLGAGRDGIDVENPPHVRFPWQGPREWVATRRSKEVQLDVR